MNRLSWPALALFSAALAPASGADTLSLDEAIRYALSHQPDVATARAQAQSASGQLRVAASGYLPTVSVSASTGRIQDQPSGYQAAATTVSARQLLFDLGRTPYSVAAARASLRAARAGDLDTRILVARSVTAAYFVLLEANGIARANADAVKSREAERDAAAAKLEAGTAPRFDLLRAETALAQSRQDLSAAQGDIRRAQSGLNNAIGRSSDAPVEAVDPADVQDVALPDAIQRALAARPDVEAARQNLEAARKSLSATRLGNAPTVSASGDLGATRSAFPATDLKWSVGVSVSFTAFDGLRINGEVQTARAGVAQAEAALRRAELTAGREVTDAITAVQVAAEQVNLGEATVRQASEARDVAVGRYQAGAGTQLEVTDAESQLLLAQVSLINSRYALAANRRALLYIMGNTP
ncbi:MAG TPA: TolC family protein [Armatimonadota bacterium]